jgi:hypothetical protein
MDADFEEVEEVEKEEVVVSYLVQVILVLLRVVRAPAIGSEERGRCRSGVQG